MEKIPSLSAPLQRISVLDGLRGFALLGVILVHVLQQFSVAPMPGVETQSLFPILDRIVDWLGEHVLSGRFINIFAFLFGMSFHIQMDRAAKRGIDFRGRFLWRMLILFLMGLVGNAFFSGDIISIYALFGAIMVFFQRAGNRVLILIAVLLLIGTPRMLQCAYRTMEAKAPLERSIVAPGEPWGGPADGFVPEGFWDSVQFNYTVRLEEKLDYQFGLIGRGYLTLALFFLGLVVGRIRFFEQLEAHKKRNIRLFWVFVLGDILVNGIIGLFPPLDLRTILNHGGLGIKGHELVLMFLDDLRLVLFSSALAMGFVLLYQSRYLGRYMDLLSPYGRMGLTHYEMQGVIGCFLFNAWALGPIFGSWGPAGLFALGILLYLFQVVFSGLWLKRFLYGPLEWVWRSATYLRGQPFKRN